MPFIVSTGVSLPKYKLSQEEAKELIRHLFPRKQSELERLLPVFDHANIEERQFIVPVDWFKERHSLSERNHLYIKEAISHSIEAIKDCISNNTFLNNDVLPNEIDCLVFVSSTGIATPTLDAYCINELGFREDVIRMPLFGLGCLGGAAGVSRVHDWLTANPKKSALLVNVEFCSLAFQKEDKRISNFVGTALFGDGVSCTLLIGDESELKQKGKGALPYIHATSSKTKLDSLDVMGWDIRDSGFHVIFAKSIPKLVDTFWKEHVIGFLEQNKLTVDDFSFFTAHPGGQKVLDAMQAVLTCEKEKFAFSYEILRNHGNMSSPTVMYCLRKAMLSKPVSGTNTLLTALGPGFSSEIVWLEWKQ